MRESQHQTTGRILWIDVVRGVMISAVVLLHATLALQVWYPDLAATGRLTWVARLCDELDQVRMPSLFLCAGLMFSACLGRGWVWFVRSRLPVLIWLIALWTVISAGAEAMGLHLVPWGSFPLVPTERLFLDPYQGLWFLYALAIVSALALLLKGLPISIQLPVVLGLSALSSGLSPLVTEAPGLALLLEELGKSALVFFMLGVWWRPVILRLAEDRRRALALQIILSVFGAGFLHFWQPQGLWWLMLAALPMTGGYLAMIRILASWAAFARLFAAIGRHSLEIFCLHQFLVAATFQLLRHYAPETEPGLVLTLLFASGLAGSLALTRVL